MIQALLVLIILSLAFPAVRLQLYPKVTKYGLLQGIFFLLVILAFKYFFAPAFYSLQTDFNVSASKLDLETQMLDIAIIANFLLIIVSLLWKKLKNPVFFFFLSFLSAASLSFSVLAPLYLVMNSSGTSLFQ